ncbi:transporter [Actinoplanes sp. OR16]|uniref:ABC transporter permease subunit n=1 Tax=Actinoplanes sp. OR16 TaxID=946334 RepID=UPI000F719AE4|nr:ABC transporter permease subunit [Actinoplanes sp. OR16]BBH70341.1 transporter [Actinoplanes sp. OR16]
MIWLTWRQFRASALISGALLLALLAGLALTWTQVTGLAAQAGYHGCTTDACAAAAANFMDLLQPEVAGDLNKAAVVILVLVPVLLGLFWGAPLVARELETGTYRMVFSQSVSRGRWLLVKLGVVGLAAALGTGLLSLALSRWATLIDAASGDRLNPLVFGARGLVPVGYALLAFVVGVTAGLLLRRTVAAMAVTLLVVAGLQIAGPLVVRPLLADPITVTVPLDVRGRYGISMNGSTHEITLHVEPSIRNAWILSSTVITASGAEFTGPADPAVCGPDAPDDHRTCPVWLESQNLSQKVVYVPGSQFWMLQWREFGVLIALTGALSALSLWWIRRRLT